MVAVLFYAVIDVVGVQERFHLDTEREAADAHVVAVDSPLRQEIEGLADGRVAPAQGNEGERGLLLSLPT